MGYNPFGYKACLAVRKYEKHVRSVTFCKKMQFCWSCWVFLILSVPVHKTPLTNWVVIESFTDPSLSIRRRIIPRWHKCNPLQAVFIPDRWADCSCFLQSNVTSYCHYLIPPSVIISWLTERGGYLSLLSFRLHCIHTSSLSFPFHSLIFLFMCSIFPFIYAHFSLSWCS